MDGSSHFELLSVFSFRDALEKHKLGDEEKRQSKLNPINGGGGRVSKQGCDAISIAQIAVGFVTCYLSSPLTRGYGL